MHPNWMEYRITTHVEGMRLTRDEFDWSNMPLDAAEGPSFIQHAWITRHTHRHDDAMFSLDGPISASARGKTRGVHERIAEIYYLSALTVDDSEPLQSFAYMKLCLM